MKEFIEEKRDSVIYKTLSTSKEQLELIEKENIDIIISALIQKGESILLREEKMEVSQKR